MRLNRIAAGLRAVAAGFGALGHVLVVWHAFARLGAVVAALRAAFEHVRREWAVTRAERGAGLATFGAVDTVLSGLGVLLFAFIGKREAVFETSVAGDLAVGADFGALHQLRVIVVTFAGSLQRDREQGHQREHCDSSYKKGVGQPERRTAKNGKQGSKWDAASCGGDLAIPVGSGRIDRGVGIFSL